MRTTRAYAVGVLLCMGHALFAADKRQLTVEDAVSTRRIAQQVAHSEVALSPDGTRVAYIVKAPDISKNTNNYELYVRELAQTGRPENGRLLLRANYLSEVQWSGSGAEIAFISAENQGRDEEEDKLNLIDLKTGRGEVIESPTRRIRSFSMDAQGHRIAFCAAVRREGDSSVTEIQNRYGFRIAPGTPVNNTLQVQNWFPDSYLYVIDRGTPGERRKVTELHPVGPSGRAIDLFNGEVAYLSLSPNGKFLIFQYGAERPPDNWAGSFYAKELQSIPFRPPLWGLLNLDTNSFRVAFDAPAYAHTRPIWSDDSRAFAISALPPIGSMWEKQDVNEGLIHLTQMDSYLHLFAVEVATLSMSEVLHRYKGVEGGNVSWSNRDRAMLVPLEGGVLLRVERTSGAWQEAGRSTLFADPAVTLQGISSSGDVAIGIREDITTPPDLVDRNLTTGEVHVLTDLNPQYREITLGAVDKISWVNKYGVKCWGYLIKPVGYVRGKKYPLVIMNKPREHFFVSDGSYTTAFPPQPLANVGFAVLMVEYYFDFRDLPQGFPGRLAEVFNWMAMVESAAQFLIDQGIADKANVGLMGFSRTSWKTDFTLTHSEFKFAAASSADSGLYNYGAYWLTNMQSSMADEEAMLGGPPYGNTLENWLKYTPAFNAQHVQCPVLMEYSGHGHLPNGPTYASEFFTNLSRQNKLVELYFYPLGDHPLDTPLERVASLQRNVDWFRFWIQGYEGKVPDYDPEQFVRWRELCKLQERNEQNRIEPPSE